MNDPLIANYQKLLFPYAYNILGSVDDALDIIQDVIVKFTQLDKRSIENPKSYLIKMVINQSLNFTKLIRRKKENYIGPWLPEPVDAENGLIDPVDKEKIVYYSLMVLLEKMKSKERAVFILKEVFDYSHQEIAELLGTSTENSRQLFKRARSKIVQPENQKEQISSENKFIAAFQNALEQKNFQLIEDLLLEDVKLKSDGGGKVSAARKIICGKESVFKFIQGIIQKFYAGINFRLVNVNRQKGIALVYENQIINLILFEFKDDMIQNVYMIRNPEKLKDIDIRMEHLL